MGPYAWESFASSDPVKLQHAKRTAEIPQPTPVRSKRIRTNWMDHEDLRDLPRAAEVFSLIDGDNSLSYSLPPVGATAGRVVQHAFSVFERIHAKLYPMIYKFGITRCAHTRWRHSQYGYRTGTDKFEEMTVIFASPECHGPAFLEATLIHHYLGNLLNNYKFSLLSSHCVRCECSNPGMV